MGEEDGTSGDDNPDRPMWVVDPIDGTANYVRGIPMSVVSIALVKGCKPILGVVRHPRLDETFSAAEGEGAFLNGKPLHVSERTREHCMVCTAWSCYNKTRAGLCFDVSQILYGICEDIRRIGTAASRIPSARISSVSRATAMDRTPVTRNSSRARAKPSTRGA